MVGVMVPYCVFPKKQSRGVVPPGSRGRALSPERSDVWAGGGMAHGGGWLVPVKLGLVVECRQGQCLCQLWAAAEVCSGRASQR